MKRIFYFITAVLLILLPAGAALAQIIGESQPFTFDTRPLPVPLSVLGLVIAGLLPVGYSLLRYFRQRKDGTL